MKHSVNNLIRPQTRKFEYELKSPTNYNKQEDAMFALVKMQTSLALSIQSINACGF